MSSRKRPADLLLLFTVIALLGIGVVMVYSASAIRCLEDYGDSLYFLKRQVIWALVGGVGLYVASRVDYFTYRKYVVWGLVGSLVLLVAVLVPGIGKVVNGARRWIGVGSLGFNPSEFAKLAFVFYFASSIAEKKEKMRKLVRGLGPYLLVLGIAAGLILKQPDLGTAISLVGTCVIMLFAGGAMIPQLAVLAVAAMPVLYIAIFREEYRRRRFMAFLDPWADPSDTGYHIIQGLYALGSGGLLGVGLGRSSQKFLYLPEAHTDFIFAIIGEELGFIGCGVIICLFFFFAWRGYKIAFTAPDPYASMLACGITSMVTVQALINIAVVTASMPITGIPLPFISHGGSSLVPVLAGVGVLMNISKYCQE